MLVGHLDELYHIKTEQLHQCAHFLLGALPVLCGKAVDRQVLYTQPGGIRHDLLQRFTALLMAERPGQTPVLRPAAVAVQDNGDMLRNLPTLVVNDIHHTVMSSLFFASTDLSIFSIM